VTDPTAPDRRTLRRAELASIAALTLVAAVLRTWRLDALPPGLHVDEAYNLLDARDVVAGWRPVFLPANAGRDVLYTYLQAPLLAALGATPAAARLASALAGTALVPVIWGFCHQLPFPRPRVVALLAAGYVTAAYWHLHFSRFGIRAVLFPVVVTGVVWAWWRLVDPKARDTLPHPPPAWRANLPATLAFGILLGLAAYTHPAGRALVVLPAADDLDVGTTSVLEQSPVGRHHIS